MKNHSSLICALRTNVKVNCGQMSKWLQKNAPKKLQEKYTNELMVINKTKEASRFASQLTTESSNQSLKFSNKKKYSN